MEEENRPRWLADIKDRYGLDLTVADAIQLVGLLLFSCFSVLLAHAIGFSLALYPNEAVFFDPGFVTHISGQLIRYFVTGLIIGRLGSLVFLFVARLAADAMPRVLVRMRAISAGSKLVLDESAFPLLTSIVQWLIAIVYLLVSYCGITKEPCDGALSNCIFLELWDFGIFVVIGLAFLIGIGLVLGISSSGEIIKGKWKELLSVGTSRRSLGWVSISFVLFLAALSGAFRVFHMSNGPEIEFSVQGETAQGSFIGKNSRGYIFLVRTDRKEEFHLFPHAIVTDINLSSKIEG